MRPFVLALLSFVLGKRRPGFAPFDELEAIWAFEGFETNDIY
jgi:hypothetical protein